MSDLMDGRAAAGIKAKILADAQEQTSGRPITTAGKIGAVIAMIVLAATLIGIYTAPFLLNLSINWQLMNEPNCHKEGPDTGTKRCLIRKRRMAVTP